MRFRLPEVSALRELNHEVIDSVLDNRIESRSESMKRWIQRSRPQGASPVIASIQSHLTRWQDITPQMRENLHTVADFLIATPTEYKLVISIDMAWIYTNDAPMLDELSECLLYAKKFSEAVVNRPRNTIVLKTPQHTHRSYFKATKLSRSEKDVIVTFINNHLDEIRPGPALKTWMEESFFRTYEYFFVDHNGLAWVTMFALVKPGLIKKTYDIISTK